MALIVFSKNLRVVGRNQGKGSFHISYLPPIPRRKFGIPILRQSDRMCIYRLVGSYRNVISYF